MVCHADVTALSTGPTFGNLTEVLLGALQDPERAQRMADAAAESFRQHADPGVIATDFHQLLVSRASQEFGGPQGVAAVGGGSAGRPVHRRPRKAAPKPPAQTWQ